MPRLLAVLLSSCCVASCRSAEEPHPPGAAEIRAGFALYEQNRCAATDVLPNLKALRVMADDLEPAFPDLADDQRFAEHASKMRARLDAALASPPLNCAGVGTTAQGIGETCKACHQDFRG